MGLEQFVCDKCIDGCLVWEMLADATSDPFQLLAGGVAHVPEISGIDLSVAAELPEKLIDKS